MLYPGSKTFKIKSIQEDYNLNSHWEFQFMDLWNLTDKEINYIYALQCNKKYTKLNNFFKEHHFKRNTQASYDALRRGEF